MSEQNSVSRRNLLKGAVTAGGVGSLFFGSSLWARLADVCGLTPPQTEGPFYPEKPGENDWDLTVLRGAVAPPKGEQVYLTGTVMDELCRPIPKALVEIWQAAESGRYNHSGDTSGLPLDPNFQYWGRAVSDENGKYLFKTIRPGHYPASGTWQRPPHIHVKVFARGYHDLTTQMYFLGSSFPAHAAIINELNRKDAILQELSKAEQERVIVAFEKGQPGSALDPNLKVGSFDITLRKVNV
jgi:protocatechuate 3,4-dioxygenase, beta subunit